MERNVLHIVYRCTENQENILFTAASNPNKAKRAIEKAIHCQEMSYGDPCSSITRQIKELRKDWNLCETIEERISMLNHRLIHGKYEVMYEGEIL